LCLTFLIEEAEGVGPLVLGRLGLGEGEGEGRRAGGGAGALRWRREHSVSRAHRGQIPGGKGNKVTIKRKTTTTILLFSFDPRGFGILKRWEWLRM